MKTSEVHRSDIDSLLPVLKEHMALFKKFLTVHELQQSTYPVATRSLVPDIATVRGAAVVPVVPDSHRSAPAAAVVSHHLTALYHSASGNNPVMGSVQSVGVTKHIHLYSKDPSVEVAMFPYYYPEGSGCWHIALDVNG